MNQSCDIAIVGAGIAGASLAAALAEAPAGAGTGAGRIVLLEAESQPGYHATGRSAAFWTESYGGPGVQPLTTASGPWLREHGFLSPRGALTLGRAGSEGRVTEFAAGFAARGVAISVLDRAGVARLVPGLRSEWTHGAWEPDCSDIDVAALHQHYLASARRAGAEMRCSARLASARPDGSGWLLELADGQRLRCDILVNAAGAWADNVAATAGVMPLGIQPLRRTVAQLAVSPAVPAGLPLVLDLDEQFYFKPEAGRLWLSPHDETPSPPCDAAAEEIEVATAIARLEEVVDWKVQRVERKWAGLRSFAPDRLPVYGFDPDEASFFWFAGQGGFGIQTAPAAAALAAALLLGAGDTAIDPGPYDPRRFR